MLWLKQDDKLTLNRIILEKSKIVLLKELINKKEKKLNSYYDVITQNVYFSDFNLEDICLALHYSIVDYNEKTTIINPFIISKLVLLERFRNDDINNVNLLFLLKNDVSNLYRIEEMANKLDCDSFKYVMKELWPDYYFFVSHILDSISFEIFLNSNDNTYLELGEINSRVLNNARNLRKRFFKN